MPTFFSKKEFADRRKAVCKELKKRDLDGLLMFRQESMYWLTGYDTFGYCFFQSLYLGADGKMTLLTRYPDAIVARQTSVIEDIRVWTNLPDADPTTELRDIVAEHGGKGGRMGIEYDAYGLTAAIYRQLDATMTGFCNLEDASDLITKLRLIKSPAEMKMARRAGELADLALQECLRLAKPGTNTGEILSRMQGIVFENDGDYSGNEFIIGAGERALVGRYISGRQTLQKTDQLTIEWAGVFRHYHAAMMRTLVIGKPSKRQLDMHKWAVEAHHASAEALKPGNTCGDVFAAYARVLDKNGYKKHRHTATGYSMGTTYPPSWMDWPMFWEGNPVVIEPGMVFFIHTLIFDQQRMLAMAPGQSYIVGPKGNEPLSKMPFDLTPD
ncbi:MAG: Xaa-Pro peptidase family protein [Proteobacteria bacterium]|nr:Xaa-Pro peptidase family protein [Pseudomonadota bacterium]